MRSGVAPEELRTFWLMGAKSRILDGFLVDAIHELTPPGGTFLDLCCGTGIVGRSVAPRQRVLANDTQRYSEIVARAQLEGGAKWRRALLDSDTVDPVADLETAYRANWRRLRSLLPGVLTIEDRLLSDIQEGRGGKKARADYRRFCEQTPEPPTPELPSKGSKSKARVAPAFEKLARGAAEWIADRRRNPRKAPFLLMTSYYANVYFGVRQAMELDSYRAAIAALPADDPFRRQKRTLYLAALVHAASVSTSGTSHFAQPRSIRKDGELARVAQRRGLSIREQFERAVDAIRAEWSEVPRNARNRVYREDGVELLRRKARRGEGVDLVYLDPPYTSDNYSRFYHVLETLVAYDYPPLQLRGGALTIGRYPEADGRFHSDFCRRGEVEGAFRAVAAGAQALGANLLVSYSEENGLLLRGWRSGGERDPVARFRRLFRDHFRHVEVRDTWLMHSGQGDSNPEVRELLVLCRGAK